MQKKSAKRLRISLDVDPETRRRIRLAAAKRDMSIRQYVLEAVKEHLKQDLEEQEQILALTAKSDPVLTELWDNKQDADYDKL